MLHRLLLLIGVVLAFSASRVDAACIEYGGYPFVQGGCVNAVDLNQALDMSISPLPPQNSVGQGAHQGHWWGDSSVTPTTLRLCVNAAGCGVSYVASDWSTVGTITSTGKLYLSAGLATTVLSSSASGQVSVGQRLFITNTATLPKTVSAPACGPSTDGMEFGVVDQVGNSSTYNVTIHPPAGTTIGGQANAIFNTNGDSVTWVCFGAGADWQPSNSSPPLPLSAASGGTGVNNGSKTITLGGNLVTGGALAFADLSASNTLLYTTAPRTVGGLATGNNRVLVTSPSGVPSFSTVLPDGIGQVSAVIGTPAGGNLGPGTLDAEGKIHSDDSFDAAALNTDGVVYTATASGTYVGGWGRGGLNGNGYKFESADDFSWYTGNTAPDTGGTLRMRLSLTGGLTVNDVSISSTPPTCDGYSDYFSGTIAVGSKNFHSSARTFVVGDVGKLITISSAGGVQSFSSGAISAPGTGYVPAQTITLTGGTETSNAVVDVLTTKVVSATVAAGGASGTPGTQTVTGTTGAGNKFTASVTVSGGGAITAVLSITAGGSYTTNPTSLTTEPVTGAGLVGAQLNVVMGVNTVAGHAGSLGSYTVVPASPVAQGSSSGSGTGATVTAAWMGNALVSSITAFTDAHDVVLNDTAVSTATGVTWGYGSDYSAQIQAGLANGVQLPLGHCGIASTLAPAYGSKMFGMGGGAYGQCATALMWLGARGGTMIQPQPSSGGATQPLAGVRVGDMCIKGLDSAADAIDLITISTAEIARVVIDGVTSRAIFEDAPTYQTGLNTYYNVVIALSSPAALNASGYVIGPGSANSDTNRSQWFGGDILFQNGNGIDIGNADGLFFYGVASQPPANAATSGAGVLFRGGNINVISSARENFFFGLGAGASGGGGNGIGGVVADASSTFPPFNNHVYGLKTGDGEPAPILNGLANALYWTDSQGDMSGGWTFNSTGPVPPNRISILGPSLIGIGGQNWLRANISNDGYFHFLAAGNSTTGFKFDTRATPGAMTIEDADGGVTLGVPTGGDKGPGTFNPAGAVYNNGGLVYSPTAPTIASGGCTTGSAQSISASNGSAAFQITLGGATCGSTITLTMPAAATDWVCDAHDITNPATNVLDVTGAASTTAVVLTNYVRTTGVAGNFTGGDKLRVKCLPY